MPRTLPWLKGGESKSQRQRSKGKLLEPNPKTEDEETPKRINGTLSGNRDIFRSSQSPPTSPIQRCPSEEYLVPGLENDDIYIMVEDEFYSVAQTFTQHLHYAEYVRRSKEAKLQNAATIRDIARPTDEVTPMSEETKKKKSAQTLSARQKQGLDRTESGRPRVDSEEEDEDGAEEDDSWAGTSLGGLMMSPRRVRSLVGTHAIKSSTRAAAGYAQTSGSRGRTAYSPYIMGETASEDDDLDLQNNGAARPLEKTPTTPASRTPTARPNSRAPHLMKEKERRTGQGSMSANHTNQLDVKTKRKSLFDDFDEFPEPDIPSTVSASRTTLARPSHASLSKERRNEHLTLHAKYTSQPDTAKRKSLFDDFDELPEPAKSRSSIKSRESPSLLDKTSQKGLQGKDSGSKKSRLNEVPMFLM